MERAGGGGSSLNSAQAFGPDDSPFCSSPHHLPYSPLRFIAHLPSCGDALLSQHSDAALATVLCFSPAHSLANSLALSSFSSFPSFPPRACEMYWSEKRLEDNPMHDSSILYVALCGKGSGRACEEIIWGACEKRNCTGQLIFGVLGCCCFLAPIARIQPTP